MYDVSILFFNLDRYDDSANYAKSASDIEARYAYKTDMKSIPRYMSLYSRKAKEEQAILLGCFDEIIDNNVPNDVKARALKNKGNSFSLLRDYHQALECYDKAIELYPKY